LPGSREISLDDRGSVVKWIEDLRVVGIPRDRESELAFGLASNELVAFHERLTKPVTFETNGVRSGDVARRIVKEVSLDFEVSTAASRAFARNELVADELQGLSHGTALSAVLRPLGLGAAPRRRVEGVQLHIALSTELAESWPVGWPRQEPPFKAAPALFEHLPVEISDFPLNKALEAIQSRVKVPFLYDHNALANFQIDLSGERASFPKSRTSYKRVLDTVLFQARLKCEIRDDDAGTPFLWITTIRR
jgi:hypothetical protein